MVPVINGHWLGSDQAGAVKPAVLSIRRPVAGYWTYLVDCYDTQLLQLATATVVAVCNAPSAPAEEHHSGYRDLDKQLDLVHHSGKNPHFTVDRIITII